MVEQGPLWKLYDGLRDGRISRRAFLQRAAALGVALPVAQFIVNAVPAGANAQQTTARPSAGTEGQTRGSGGELKLLQWQAATHASIHTSTGFKDTLAAALVTEPLMSFLADATLSPTLVKEVPSVENGLVAPDLTSVTYNLLEGVVWSDGQPFTANDVAFTYQWIINPENAATTISSYDGTSIPLANVEALDELTVKLTFSEPTLAWYLPFTSSFGGGIYPAHVLGQSADAINEFRQKPTGTGPYVVESFAENDQVIYVPNENYREPNKPFFSRVNLKGGGDATSAARAVLQTGDYDVAWNLQVEPAILQDMEQAGKGEVVVVLGGRVERLAFNFSDPDTEAEGQRSYWKVPHPILSDKAVRQAMALGTDRATLAEQLYNEGEPPAADILAGIPAYDSPNTAWEFDLEQAKQILDEAGWVMDGDVRKKDGRELSFSYATSINSIRQKTQAVNKQNWEELGIKVQLKQVDAGIYFDSAAGNEQNVSHFYNDLQMYTNGASDPFPTSYMSIWYAGPDGSNIAQASNDWSGANEQRYNNPEYDAIFDALGKETDAEAAAQMFIQLNDILINDYVMVPQVNRAAEVYAISNTMNKENVGLGMFEALYWNVANWNRVG